MKYIYCKIEELRDSENLIIVLLTPRTFLSKKSCRMEDEEKRLHMAVIAGAAKAIDYKEQNPRALKEDIIQHVTENAKEIINKIDDPL